jgi:pimeloyl-ACP methyl ester carboxylesterase
MQTIRLQANGINFEVFIEGSGDRLALCLHGFPECAFSWRFQMPLLAQLGYRVWAPNLRGYGGTDSPADIDAYQLEALVEDVAALIRASGAKETLLIAHDWGGMLAWLLASWQPSLVQRLVICNLPHPSCFLREVKRPVQFFKSWYVLFFQLPWLPEALLGVSGAKAVGDAIRRTACDRSRFPDEVLAIYRRNASRPGGLRAMINWYRALLRGGGAARLRKQKWPVIQIPTLIIWGDADTALSIRTLRGTEQYVSDLTVHVLPGVSHWVQQEAAETVNVTLQEWLPAYHGE